MIRTPVYIEGGTHAGRSGVVAVAPMEIERRARLTQRIAVKLDRNHDGAGLVGVRANCLRVLSPWRTTIEITAGRFTGSRGWCHGSPSELARLPALSVNLNGVMLYVSNEDARLVRSERVPGRGGRP